MYKDFKKSESLDTGFVGGSGIIWMFSGVVSCAAKARCACCRSRSSSCLSFCLFSCWLPISAFRLSIWRRRRFTVSRADSWVSFFGFFLSGIESHILSLNASSVKAAMVERVLITTRFPRYVPSRVSTSKIAVIMVLSTPYIFCARSSSSL